MTKRPAEPHYEVVDRASNHHNVLDVFDTLSEAKAYYKKIIAKVRQPYMKYIMIYKWAWCKACNKHKGTKVKS